jgi:hypothetical protein
MTCLLSVRVVVYPCAGCRDPTEAVLTAVTELREELGQIKTSFVDALERGREREGDEFGY